MVSENLRKAQDGLDARDAAKRAASLKDPNVDTSAATARKAKAAGDRPWVDLHQDAVSGAAAATGGVVTKRTV